MVQQAVGATSDLSARTSARRACDLGPHRRPHLGGAQGFHHWAEHAMCADGPTTVALLDPDEFFLEPLTQVRTRRAVPCCEAA